MCQIFSKQPPVYSKPPQAAARPPPQYRPQNNWQKPPGAVYGGVQQNYGMHDNTEQLRDQVNTKMREYLTQELNEISDENYELCKRQARIERKKKEIDQTFAQSEEEFNKLQKRKADLISEKERLEKWLADNEGNSRIDVDNVISANDTHAEQLFEVTAEDYALSDVQYELEECLNDELINLSTFLKQIRKVSRNQFFARALANKLKTTMAQGHGMQPPRQQQPPRVSPNFRPQPMPNRPPPQYGNQNMYGPPPPAYGGHAQYGHR